MHHLFWKSLFLGALTLASAPLLAQNEDRNCCLISSSPGALVSAQLGETVPYSFSVDVGKCGGNAVEWTWEPITAGISIPSAAGGSADLTADARPPVAPA